MRRDPRRGTSGSAAGAGRRCSVAAIAARSVYVRAFSDRGAGAAAELLGELDVGRVERPRRRPAREDQRSRPLPAGRERHDDDRRHAQLPQHAEVLLVLRVGAQLLVADLGAHEPTARRA